MSYKDRSKQREYQRRWKAERRRAWLADKACIDCGTSDDLQIDHVDASKKVDHRVWSWARERRESELDKCVVRCSDHHKEKTLREREHAFGSRVSASKLTDEMVREIRTKHLEGSTKRGLAREYEIDEKAVRMLISRQTWRHVT